MTSDGERCGKTLIDLFAKAKDPDKVIVGLIEQTTEDETHCIEAYCNELGKYIVEYSRVQSNSLVYL
jgi:hypothetical protein